jgi:hypothetical protein
VNETVFITYGKTTSWKNMVEPGQPKTYIYTHLDGKAKKDTCAYKHKEFFLTFINLLVQEDLSNLMLGFMGL